MPITIASGSTIDRAAFDAAMNYLYSIDNFASIVQKVDVIIQFNHNDNDTYSNGVINWDPYSGLRVVDANGVEGVQSAALGLYHELVHALQLSGNTAYMEFAATIDESRAAAQIGEPTRAYYNSTWGTIALTNTTQHTNPDGVWQSVTTDGNTLLGTPYVPGQPAPDQSGEAAGSGGGGGDESSGGDYGGGSGSGGTISGSNDDDPTGGGYWQLPGSTAPSPTESTLTMVETNDTGSQSEAVLIGIADHDVSAY